MIPTRAVEAAAKAIYATEAQPMYDEAKEKFTGARPWEWLTERSWDFYRDKARLALEAAAPYIRAQALEDAAEELDQDASKSSYRDDELVTQAQLDAAEYLRARAVAERGGE